jgi:hypothetical protein
VKVPIPMGERLIVEQCQRTQEETEDMAHVPYASVVGSLMYVMVYIQPNISHVVRDLTPHIGRIIYFHVIKVNINKA